MSRSMCALVAWKGTRRGQAAQPAVTGQQQGVSQGCCPTPAGHHHGGVQTDRWERYAPENSPGAVSSEAQRDEGGGKEVTKVSW